MTHARLKGRFLSDMYGQRPPHMGQSTENDTALIDLRFHFSSVEDHEDNGDSMQHRTPLHSTGRVDARKEDVRGFLGWHPRGWVFRRRPSWRRRWRWRCRVLRREAREGTVVGQDAAWDTARGFRLETRRSTLGPGLPSTRGHGARRGRRGARRCSRHPETRPCGLLGVRLRARCASRVVAANVNLF